MQIHKPLPKIGFIGLGVMGAPIAKHLLEAGFPLFIHTRTSVKAEHLLKAGANWCDSPEVVAHNTRIIFTMLGYPSDVQKVYNAPTGLIARAARGTILIDMTTSEPHLAQQIATKSAAKGLFALDAPVTGGEKGAQTGTLSTMVGGDESSFNTMLPIFDHFSIKCVRQGDPGAGQHAKLSNQIALAGIMMSLCESYQYALRAGLNPSTVLESIGDGAASSWPMKHLLPAIINGDDRPGFYVKHFLKDLEIAIDSAEALYLDLPTLKQARKLYHKLVDMGYADKGTQSLYHWYIDRNG